VVVSPYRRPAELREAGLDRRTEWVYRRSTWPVPSNVG